MRLLIADDERLVRYSIRSMVEEMSLPFQAVHEARDGESLVESVRRLEPQIALVDIQMPKLNGLKAISSLVSDHPGTVFVILSAHNDFSYAQEAIHLGVFRYLLKPVDPAELEPVLREAISLSRRTVKEDSDPSADDGSAPGDYSFLIRRALRWIEENYRNGRGLNEAAEALDVTPAYLTTTFKTQTGETFLRYLTRHRLEKARELVEKGATIGDTARAVGYTNSRHFARRFREFYGASPTELRERRKSDTI